MTNTDKALYRRRAGKIEVRLEQFDRYNGKLWLLLNTPIEWMPSFEELFWILKYLSYCENVKYPPEQGYKGWQMVAEFCADACKPDADIEELRVKYKLPKRT